MPELTILGCGSSVGVPIIGCRCKVCTSPSPYNKRLRSAILISSESTNLLIDFGCDIRQQLLSKNITRLDGVILTHFHADHIAGFDDLRVFKIIHNNKLSIYSDEKTLAQLEEKYRYLFGSEPIADLRPVDFYSKVKVGDIELQLFRQHHGSIDSLGLRVGDLVYMNDVVDYPLESKEYLHDAAVMIMDCVDYNSVPTHSGLDTAMKWREEFKPKQVYLTNMSHRIDYFEIAKHLPDNVAPAYDGMKIKVNRSVA